MLKNEKKLWKKGFKRVAGLDESGRGPLAGPVVAAGVIIDPLIKLKEFKNVNDSKKLSVKQREYFFNLIINHPLIEHRISWVSEKTIDKINILQATKKAMQSSVRRLKPDFLIIDGNFSLKTDILQKSIIKADQKVLSCMLASILAKVYRDKLMKNYDKKYPLYNFSKHKGYPTKEHYKLIKKYKTCPLHRKTFI